MAITNNPVTRTVDTLFQTNVQSITGNFTGVSYSSFFTPIAGRAFNLEIKFNGATAEIQLERALDGVNFSPLTGSGNEIMRFSDSSNEQFSEPQYGVKYRLNCTSFVASSGTINYILSQ